MKFVQQFSDLSSYTCTHTVNKYNNRGQVVGASDLPGDEVGRAFLWDNGVLINLGTLPDDVASAAYGINSKGQIVGGSYDADGNSRPFLWQDGIMTDLNSLVSTASSLFLLDATGKINASGQIAGLAFDVNTGEIHAYLASPRDGALLPEKTAINRKVVLPENLRELLRRNIKIRYHFFPLKNN